MLTAALLVGISGAALAQEDEPGETRKRIAEKAGRGFVNLITGWAEIPKQVDLQWKETNGWDAASKGFAKGFVHAFARTAVGAYEILTFPIPVPEGYRPIIHPELINSDQPK
jgi:putative exosortase-associated protein (TIGR04073 family)